MVSIIVEFFLFIIGYKIEDRERTNGLKCKDGGKRTQPMLSD